MNDSIKPVTEVKLENKPRQKILTQYQWLPHPFNNKLIIFDESRFKSYIKEMQQVNGYEPVIVDFKLSSWLWKKNIIEVIK